MKPGETLEAAIWIDGKESRVERESYENAVCDQFRERCSGLVYSPVTFTEKKPGDERVPPVPDHIQGPDVRLLVAEVTITGYIVGEVGLTNELEKDDLDRLRALTRREFATRGRVLTIEECDSIINEIGPEAALDTLRG